MRLASRLALGGMHGCSLQMGIIIFSEAITKICYNIEVIIGSGPSEAPGNQSKIVAAERHVQTLRSLPVIPFCCSVNIKNYNIICNSEDW